MLKYLFVKKNVANFGTNNPATIKDGDELNRLKEWLDNLKPEDFKPSKKKESK